MNAASLPTLWANCAERLKDRVNNRSFWEAIEQVHPVTIENDTLIIGLDTLNFNLASHIQQTSTLHAVVTTVSEVFNQPLQIRLIEGTTLADWEAAKERDARIAAMKQQTVTRKVADNVNAESWDALYDQIARLYAQTPHRAMPQGKAHYANEALYMLAEAMDTLYADNADEVTERSLARILERIANASEIPAPMLAFELERLRAWRRSEAG